MGGRGFHGFLVDKMQLWIGVAQYSVSSHLDYYADRKERLDELTMELVLCYGHAGRED